MIKLMKRIKRLLAALASLVALLAVIVYLRYGGGTPSQFQVGMPLLAGDALETVIAYPEPIGNVAASQDTAMAQRVFFTVHPESRPERIKLLEIIDGQGIPYPSEAAQSLFLTPLGVYCDQQNRLWVIDHGNHGTDSVKLLAFDLRNDNLLASYHFPKEVAELGSFFNDLSVSPDGRWVVIADVSFWRKKPSLVILDTQTGRSKSWLDGHSSVQNQGLLPVNDIKKMRFFGGLADLMPGIDGIDIDPSGQWVYYAAMSHHQLFRVPLRVLTQFDADPSAVAKAVESVSDKPLSDGIRVDSAQRILVTDVDHNGIYVAEAETKKTYTLLKDQRIRWADGLSYGANGFWYLADSAIPHQMLQSKKHIQANAPYYIYRFKWQPE